MDVAEFFKEANRPARSRCTPPGVKTVPTADYVRSLVERLRLSGADATRSSANMFMLSRNVNPAIREGVLEGLFPNG